MKIMIWEIENCIFSLMWKLTTTTITKVNLNVEALLEFGKVIGEDGF